jgi:hypothetical protein
MKVPPWCKPAFWGVVVGAVGIMIIGFAWGGWVLGSTAERLANDRADGPEYGGGTGLRSPAREPQDLASSHIRRDTHALDHRPRHRGTRPDRTPPNRWTGARWDHGCPARDGGLL